MNAHQEDREFDVFVPIDRELFDIRKGSAIVAGASQRGQAHRIVYYEGNIYDCENLRAFDDRCLHATGRAAKRYPTVAKTAVSADQLRLVGCYDLAQRKLTVVDEGALAQWISKD